MADEKLAEIIAVGERAARTPKGTFRAKSGNPRGKPKGYRSLAAYIRSQTTDGEELIAIMLGMARGTLDTGVSSELRFKACKELLDRGIGKAPDVLEIYSDIEAPIDAKIDFSNWSEEMIDMYFKMRDYAKERALAPAKTVAGLVDVEGEEK